MQNTWFDEFFRDKDGNIVIVQPPNLPISIWSVASILKLIFPTGSINGGLELIATVSLFVWSLAELFQGDSNFRRSLGAIALVGLIVSKIS
jgi:hypothetical protein